ncbi:MAG: hypothetical protein ABSG41_25485, partial [Bryobacteraceae bacterium]
MSIPRRTILGLAGAGLLPRLLARPFLFEVDRLLDEIPQSRANVCQRRYGAKATITLLSVPIVSRAGVGSGYIVTEQSSGREDVAGPGSRTVGIQFGAGSWPEAARGLNRLGFIQEGVVEDHSGQLLECAYFAFMTTSQEENLDQAKKALESSDGTVPYVAAEGEGRPGRFASRLHRIGFPSRLTWRDCPLLVDKVRAVVSSEAPAQRMEKTLPAREAAPSTFLYAVRKAILDPNLTSTGSLIYNGKEFELRTEKEPDAVASAHFAMKNLVREGGRVMRLNATLREYATGRQTPFKVWYEAGSEHMPPLRFEYQARPFLRLTFEYDPATSGPDI